MREGKKGNGDVKTEAREKVDGNTMSDSEFLKNEVLCLIETPRSKQRWRNAALKDQ